MFGNSLLCIFSLAAVATAASLSLKAPGTNGVQDLNVVATIADTGTVSITLVEHTGGSRNKVHKAAHSHSRDFGIVLSPEERVKIEYKLAEAHGFARSRFGKSKIRPTSKEVLIVENDGAISALYAESPARHDSIYLSDQFFISQDPGAQRVTSMAEVTYIGCSGTQMTDVNEAIVQARTWLIDALAHVQQPENVLKDSERLKSWFGVYNTIRRVIVSRHIRNVYNRGFDTFTFTCQASQNAPACGPRDYAETATDNQLGETILCPLFFSSNAGNKALTLIHESSHIDGPNPGDEGTDDIKYGPEKCMILAQQEPDESVKNADNIAYYAANWLNEAT